MQTPARSLIALLAIVALALPVISSAQDEESSLWVSSTINYRHRNTADEVLWNQPLPSAVSLNSSLHTNDTWLTVVDPVAQLLTPYTVVDWAYEPPVEAAPGLYRWEFATIVPPDFARTAEVWLDEEETAPITFTPGFDIARTVSPTSITYPGGEVTVTVTYTIEDNMFFGQSAAAAGISAWGVFDWQPGADFMATLSSVTDHDGFGCSPVSPGDMYAYCYTENYQVGATYTIEAVFDVVVDEGIQRIEWMPSASGQLSFPNFWNYQSADGSVTLTDEYGAWTWFTEYPGHFLASQQHSKFVELDHRFSSSTAIDAAIDVKPGSYANALNARSKGKIPVAILATDTFDPLDPAAGVDPSSVRFAGAAKAHPNKPLGHWEDVDGDGDVDLLLHFDTSAVFGNPDGLSCGDTQALLTALTYDGLVVEGADVVITVGCR